MQQCATIDDYIAALPDWQQTVMQQVRATIHSAAPLAQERISYQMPSFWQGATLIWFAAAKHHIGIYPTASGVRAFADQLKPYGTSKGAIRLPWDAPPYDLIAEITRFRLAEVQGA